MLVSGSTLQEVAAALDVAYVGPLVAIRDVHHDSRAVVDGSAFVAVAGATFDGHDFVEDAITAGAAAVIVERPVNADIAQLVVPDSRKALAVAASVVHGYPSRRLAVVGVTGTNGKTTVTHMIDAIARSSGIATGVVGTLGARIGDRELRLDRTTPESSDLQRLLADMASAGVRLVAMEVSSHALALHRADAVNFGVVAFTNLSQDHLDFHGTMMGYFIEKSRLFLPEVAQRAVIWVDDPWGSRLAANTPLEVTRVGLGPGADVSASEIATDHEGSRFLLRIGRLVKEVQLPIPALFNVANSLVAAGACAAAGIGFDDICAGLGSLPRIRGRFEVVPGTWPFLVVVDYAHTPDAVAAVIREARSLTEGRVVAVVGAGGDRDHEKRPKMGAAAGTADVTILTSDNPRSEDPEAIVAEVRSGIPQRSRLIVEVDRRRAIRAGLAEADDIDIVLILGKGHEQGQELAGGRVEPFDDRTVVVEEGSALAAKEPS